MLLGSLWDVLNIYRMYSLKYKDFRIPSLWEKLSERKEYDQNILYIKFFH